MAQAGSLEMGCGYQPWPRAEEGEEQLLEVQACNVSALSILQCKEQRRLLCKRQAAAQQRHRTTAGLPPALRSASGPAQRAAGASRAPRGIGGS